MLSLRSAGAAYCRVFIPRSKPFTQNLFRATMATEVEKAQELAAKGDGNVGGDTIFGKIIRKEIPAELLYEDDLCIAIRDVNPQAPVHVLVIPKEPVKGLSSTEDIHVPLLGHLFNTVRKVAVQEGLGEGYRTVINDGKNGCQSVPHLHIHLLGKRQLGWPPG